MVYRDRIFFFFLLSLVCLYFCCCCCCCCLHCLCQPRQTAAVSAQVPCTPCSLQCDVMQSLMRRCMRVQLQPATYTFGRMARIFLRATAVTRGWNGYRNKSQHRKLTPEKKILQPFLQGLEAGTFGSRVGCSNH